METARRVAWGLAAATALLTATPALRPWEDAAEDMRFRLRGSRPTTARIVLALADQETLARWPEPIALWSRRLLGAARGARRAGAKVVALDIIPSADADRFLGEVAVDSLRAAGLDARRIAQIQPTLDGDDRFAPDQTLAEWLRTPDGNGVVLGDDSVGSLNEALRHSGADIGLVVLPEEAGPLRRFDRRWRGAPTLPALVAGQVRSDAPFALNYVDPQPGRAFVRVPLHALATPDAATRAQLDGAIVLVGMGDPRFNDRHAGIGGAEFDGTELLAHATATLVDGRELRRAPGWAEALAALLVGAGSVGIAGRLRFATGGAALLGLGLAGAAGAQLAFARADFLLPVAGTALALVLPFAGFHLGQAAAERRTRQEIERVFGQYLSPRVRDYLLTSSNHRALGGRQTEATVLFFDLRGSTAFAEGRAPEAVVEALNEIFASVVPCLQAEEGIVLKYIGDGFLAVFGAPMPAADHAAAAVRAVRAIGAAVARLNAARGARGEAPWGFGCGLHSGPLVFGNVGVAERPEFTVIGDTVNLSARLQDASKELGATVVLSEATWRAAGCPAGARGPLPVSVRGRREPVAVYVLEGMT